MNFIKQKQIAELLKVSPLFLREFEKRYKVAVLNNEDLPSNSDNIFDYNSRQATKISHEAPEAQKFDADKYHDIIKAIADELEAITEIYAYSGKNTYFFPTLSTPATVKKEDILAIPKSHRPQLSGNYMTIDADPEPSSAILMFYRKAIKAAKAGNTTEAQDCYNLFRQGLDILDLDYLTYKIIDQNINSMGYWFPALLEACKNQDFFKIPKTCIAKVPMQILQMTRLDYSNITPCTKAIINKWADDVFQLDTSKKYFIKTGTFSSKFDFRNAKVSDPKEVKEIGEYLLFVHFQALMMASPLSKPCIYGASTTTEWVVREYIEDKENAPTIYKGLPLHTEYRVFIDCDIKQVIGMSPYWKPDLMLKRFSEIAKETSDSHDYIVFQAYQDTLMARYEANKDKIKEKVEAILPDLRLSGQWSLDIMQNGNDFWIIDMGTAERSALYDCVPAEFRKPVNILKERWLPKLN